MLRVVADLCCDGAVGMCCALFGFVCCCGKCVLNVVGCCCWMLFMCCSVLLAVDLVFCRMLSDGVLRRCALLVAIVGDVVVCCLLVPCDD